MPPGIMELLHLHRVFSGVIFLLNGIILAPVLIRSFFLSAHFTTVLCSGETTSSAPSFIGIFVVTRHFSI